MGNDNCSEASISEILLKWYMYHLDFAYTYKFHKIPITSLAEDWAVSCIKADQKNPAKPDDPEIYESRQQPLHTWATFCSTISKAAPSVTCRSKTNRNFRLPYSTLDEAPRTDQRLPSTSGTLFTSRLHSAGATCDHRLAWMHYGPVVWKISTALIFCTAFVHPVADASLERFETEAVRSPAPCIHSAFSSSLNSAQFEFCLQPPTALQMALPGPLQETPRAFLVCPTLSLQMDRRAWWRLQGVGCSKLAQD